MVQLLHGYSVHHGHLASVVLEDEHHIEVLEVELYSLEVNQLNLIQCDDERGLKHGKN